MWKISIALWIVKSLFHFFLLFGETNLESHTHHICYTPCSQVGWQNKTFNLMAHIIIIINVYNCWECVSRVKKLRERKREKGTVSSTIKLKEESNQTMIERWSKLYDTINSQSSQWRRFFSYGADRTPSTSNVTPTESKHQICRDGLNEFS